MISPRHADDAGSGLRQNQTTRVTAWLILRDVAPATPMSGLARKGCMSDLAVPGDLSVFALLCPELPEVRRPWREEFACGRLGRVDPSRGSIKYEVLVARIEFPAGAQGLVDVAPTIHRPWGVTPELDRGQHPDIAGRKSLIGGELF